MQTMGEIAATGTTWKVKCRKCGREVRIPPEDLARIFPADLDQMTARQRLKCKRCFTRGENYLSEIMSKEWWPVTGGMGNPWPPGSG